MESERIIVRPSVLLKEALEYARDIYGFQISLSTAARELPSYDDRNFYLKGKLEGDQNEQEYILKVMNSMYSYNQGYLDAMDHVMLHINHSQNGISCTIPIKSLSGSTKCKVEIPIEDPVKVFSLLFGETKVEDEMIKQVAKDDPFLRIKESEDGSITYLMRHYVRLLTFLPGKPVSHLQRLPDEILIEAGVFVGRVKKALKDFHHSEINSLKVVWHLDRTCDLEYPYLASIKDTKKYGMIRSVIEEFKTVTNLDKLPKQTIHGDINPTNVLISQSLYEDIKKGKDISLIGSNGNILTSSFDSNGSNATEISSEVASDVGLLTGLIDFGETNYNSAIFELAICMAYFAIECPEYPLRAAGLVLSGFKRSNNLTSEEELVLPILVKARLAQSLAIGYYQYNNQDQGNDYLAESGKEGWNVLEAFLAVDNTVLLSRFNQV